MKFKRIFVCYIDFCILGLLVFPLESQFSILIVKSIVMSLIFCFKDFFFGNASIGKKIFGLEVITIDDKKPSLYKLFFRNITIVIFPFIIFEVFMLLLYGRRIGDVIFKTKVV